MPRTPRVDVGGEIYHIINRANARLPIFFAEEDYELFEAILEEAQDQRYLTPLADPFSPFSPFSFSPLVPLVDPFSLFRGH